MLLLLLLAQAAAGAEPPAAPPPATAPIDTLHQHVVEAIRNCPPHMEGEVVVCARDRGIAEGYRLPRLDPRYAGAALRPSGRGTVDGGDVGQVGTGSCSNVGAGGGTGCTLQAARAWSRWKAQRKAAGDTLPW